MSNSLPCWPLVTLWLYPAHDSRASGRQTQHSTQAISSRDVSWLASKQCHLSLFILGLPYRSVLWTTCVCRERGRALSISGALVWQLDLTGVWKMEMWHHTNLRWTHQSLNRDENVTSLSFFICSKFTRTLKCSRLQWTQISILSMFCIKQSNSSFHFWTHFLLVRFQLFSCSVLLNS